jgi:hypothetical protein
MLRQALKVLSTSNPRPLVSLPRPNQLHGLPTELLQYITSTFLPLTSAAALALSSRFILAKLGTGYFTQLKKASPLPPVTSRSRRRRSYKLAPTLSQPQQELEDFLILLDRDIRDTIYCYYCRTIHDPMKTLRWSWKNNFKPIRPCRRWKIQVAGLVHLNFAFSRFQMIMKRSRFGIDYSAQLRKLSTTCTRYSEYPRYKVPFTHQVTTYARLVSGCLLLRTVQWLLFEWEGDLRWPPRRIRLCHHLYALDKDLPSPFITGAYGHMSLRHGAGIELKRCHTCATEYEMDGAECGRDWFVLRVTVWQDFGDCSSGYFDLPKCKHSRKFLGSPPHSTASPSWNVKAEFEDSCSEAQKLGTRLERPTHLQLAKHKVRQACSYRYYSSYYNVALMIY